MTGEKKRLSRQDEESRLKLIQEYHYDKYEQRLFDEAVAELPYSYTEIYSLYRRGAVFGFMASISHIRVSKVIIKFPSSIQVLIDGAGRLAEVMRNSEEDY